jgi:hypothetical protein
VRYGEREERERRVRNGEREERERRRVRKGEQVMKEGKKGL